MFYFTYISACKDMLLQEILPVAPFPNIDILFLNVLFKKCPIGCYLSAVIRNYFCTERSFVRCDRKASFAVSSLALYSDEMSMSLNS